MRRQRIASARPLTTTIPLLALLVALAPTAGVVADGGMDSGDDEHAQHLVYSWGLNNVGQLGTVDTLDRRKPALVTVLTGKKITQLAMGGSEQVDSHTLAIVEPGKLYATGDNTYGQLGLGDNGDRESFQPVQAVFHKTFASVDCGEAHSVAVTAEGEVYVWGSNTRQQLCNQDCSAQSNTPMLLSVPDTGSPVVGAAAGAWHTVVWTAGGEVLACGDNSMGQLGNGEARQRWGLVPVALPKGTSVKEVAAGGHHNLLLTKEGALYGWGNNAQGQLGLQTEENPQETVTTPVVLPSFAEAAIRLVQAGFGHSVAIDGKGNLYAWGNNAVGQTGIMLLQGAGGGGGVGRQTLSTASDKGGLKAMHTPRMVMSSTKWATVACGRMHTTAITLGGHLYAWGGNAHGQLGLGDVSPRAAPTQVNRMSEERATVMSIVASGSGGTLAVTSTGDLYGWGRNNAGQLGLPRSKAPQVTPMLVMRAARRFRVTQVAAGGYAYQYEGHSVLLTENNEVFTWGWNAFGQLGVGEVDDAHPIPLRNTWLHRLHVVHVSAGQFASAAVTADGDVYTWGQNDCGQLGRGDFTSGPSDTPQKLHLDAKVVQVAIGYSHMLALTDEGRVYAWGHNFYGQLGVGDHKDKASPQLLSYLQEDRISQVVAGQYHSFAISSKGEMYGWGYNRDYELGVGDNMDRVLPQAVAAPQGHKVTSLSCGAYHTLAVMDNGALYAWGLNNYGQLGIKERTSMAKVPTAVYVEAGAAKRRLRVMSAAAGTWHSLVLAEDNGVYSFGRCQYGQLGIKCHTGNDKSSDQYHPTAVEGLNNQKVVAVAAGAAHSLAVVMARETPV